MKSKTEALENNKTWDVVPLPKHKTLQKNLLLRRANVPTLPLKNTTELT